MKEYYMSGTNDKVEFGDFIKVEMLDKQEDGIILKKTVKCVFEKELVPLLLKKRIIEERETEDPEKEKEAKKKRKEDSFEPDYNFSSENKDSENKEEYNLARMLGTVIRDQEDVEEIVEELQKKITYLEGKIDGIAASKDFSHSPYLYWGTATPMPHYPGDFFPIVTCSFD